MTNEQKNIAYTQCFFDIESNKHDCCCGSFIEKGLISLNESAEDVFPELFELRTYENPIVYWFRSKQERIEALKKCIEQTKS